MADKDKCLASVSALAKELGLDKAEIADAIKALESEKLNLDSTRPIDDNEKKFFDAAVKIEDELLLNALQRKRNAALQLKTFFKEIDHIDRNFVDDNFAHGLKNAINGVQGNVISSKRSASADGDVVFQRWMGGMFAELESTKLFPRVQRSELDVEMAAVIYERIGKNDPNVKISDGARAVTEILEKYKSVARRQANEVGGDIRELTEHIYQSHNKYRLLLDKSGRQTDIMTAKSDWMELNREIVDFQRVIDTTETVEIEKFLNSFYDSIVTGVNLKALGSGADSAFSKSVGGSKARILHFKSSEGFIQYNDRYGNGTILEGVVSNLRLMALDTEMMRRFGPNVRQGLESMREHYIVKTRQKQSNQMSLQNLKKEFTDWKAAVKADKYLTDLENRKAIAMSSKGGRKLRKQLEKEIAKRIKSNPRLAKLKKAHDASITAGIPEMTATNKDLRLLTNQESFGALNDIDGFGKLATPNYTLESAFKSATGELHEGTASNAAKFANNLRSYFAMVDLGMTTITAWGDLGNFYKEARAGGDDKFLSPIMGSLKELGRQIKTVKVAEGSDIGKVPFMDADLRTPFSLKLDPDDHGNNLRKEALALVGGMAQSMSANPGMRMTGDDVLSADMAKKAAAGFKINLLTPWTDGLRQTAQIGFSQSLANRRHLTYDQLSKDKDNVITMFREFGITPTKWDLIRQNNAYHTGDGKVLMAPEFIQKAPQMDIERGLAETEIESVGNNLKRLKSGVETREKRIKQFDAPKKVAEREAALVGLAVDKKQIKEIHARAEKVNSNSTEFEKLNRTLVILESKVQTVEKRLRKQAETRTNLHDEIKRNKKIIEELSMRRFELENFKEDIDSGKITHESFFDDELSMFRDNEVQSFRDEIERDMSAYIIQRSERAILAPSADTLAIKQLGFNRNSAEGIFANFLFMYKTFAIGQTKDVLGRDFIGDLPPGTTPFGKKSRQHHADQMRNNFKDSSFFEVTKFIAYMTLIGYISKSAKDILTGKKPRDPTDPKVWLASMLQSGGAGIYGDLLFGTQDRFGRSPLISLLGPAAGRLDDTIRLGIKGRDALFGDDKANFSAHAMRVGMRNTPFANLFYTKMGVDYLIIYHLQEAMNPGYLKRMEKRMKEMENVEHYLRPSEVVK